MAKNNFLHKINNKSGFTLIELLVVIAIIGTLASVVLASLNSARVKARDAARLAQGQEIRKALELYYTTNGHYPIFDGNNSARQDINELAYLKSGEEEFYGKYLPSPPIDSVYTYGDTGGMGGSSNANRWDGDSYKYETEGGLSFTQAALYIPIEGADLNDDDDTHCYIVLGGGTMTSSGLSGGNDNTQSKFTGTPCTDL